MFKDTKAFSGFSVDDIQKAKEFYQDVLGLNVELQTIPMEMLTLNLATGGIVLAYPKGGDHKPATFTVLNFPVDNIDEAVNELTAKGVKFLQYDNKYIKTDEKGIARSDKPEHGPNIAWFSDPAGNNLSVIEVKG